MNRNVVEDSLCGSLKGGTCIKVDKMVRSFLPLETLFGGGRTADMLFASAFRCRAQGPQARPVAGGE